MHRAALYYDVLKSVLNAYADTKQREQLVSQLLLRNYEGKTPLDIAIENESPKCVEIILKNLKNIESFLLSRMFYKSFHALF